MTVQLIRLVADSSNKRGSLPKGEGCIDAAAVALADARDASDVASLWWCLDYCCRVGTRKKRARKGREESRMSGAGRQGGACY